MPNELEHATNNVAAAATQHALEIMQRSGQFRQGMAAMAPEPSWNGRYNEDGEFERYILFDVDDYDSGRLFAP